MINKIFQCLVVHSCLYKDNERKEKSDERRYRVVEVVEVDWPDDSSFMSSSSMASGVSSPGGGGGLGCFDFKLNFLPPSTTLMLTVALFDLWLEQE